MCQSTNTYTLSYYKCTAYGTQPHQGLQVTSKQVSYFHKADRAVHTFSTHYDKYILKICDHAYRHAFLISKALTRYLATSIFSNFIKYINLSILVSERKSWYLLEILLYKTCLTSSYILHTHKKKRNDTRLQQYFLRTPSIPCLRYSHFSNVQFQF